MTHGLSLLQQVQVRSFRCSIMFFHNVKGSTLVFPVCALISTKPSNLQWLMKTARNEDIESRKHKVNSKQTTCAFLRYFRYPRYAVAAYSVLKLVDFIR